MIGDSHYQVSDDPSKLDFEVIYQFISTSYWGEGCSRKMLQDAIANSHPFGLFKEEEQIGFARVITDYASFAYLSDVFVLNAYQGQGLGKWLLTCIFSHEAIQPQRGWLLRTADAHSLYAQFGFQPLAKPTTWLAKPLDLKGF